jgi:hypothetical protein
MQLYGFAEEWFWDGEIGGSTIPKFITVLHEVGALWLFNTKTKKLQLKNIYTDSIRTCMYANNVYKINYNSQPQVSDIPQGYFSGS